MKHYKDRSNFFSFGVGAVIANYNNEMLLVKKRSTGQWLLPSGLVQNGETLLKTLKREVREETGIIIDDKCIKTEGIIALRHKYEKRIGNNLWIVFLVKTTPSSLLDINVKDTDEIKEARFFKIENLLKNKEVGKATKIILQKYQKNKTLFRDSGKRFGNKEYSFYHLFL